MTAAWPAGSIDPYPLNESFAHVFADRLSRNTNEQGMAKQRSVYRTALVTLQMSWAFSAAGFETFRTFYDRTVDGGTLPFTMDAFTGSAYENLTLNFVKGSVKPKKQGGEWIVAAELETAELSVMSSGALDALIGAAPGDGSLPVWPSNYFGSEPLGNDFDAAFPDPSMRGDFEDGYAPQQRIFKAAPATLTASYPMTNAKYDAFRAWRKYRAFNGEGRFSMAVFRGGSYENHDARIVKGSLKATRQGPDWLVRMALELRDLAAAA
jgi:hypothetical protein